MSRLRRFAREGAAEELDLDDTIRSTADHGYLDVKMRPERRNAVKVLLFLDVGGSMDWHVEAAESLFAAARLQFKRLEHFYFHNCLYESVWKSNQRRFEERTPTIDVINSFGRDHRVVFVGDAAMGPHEILATGGSVEHHNPESGETWLKRAVAHWPRSVWINPSPPEQWAYAQSTRIISACSDSACIRSRPMASRRRCARWRVDQSRTTSTEHCAWRTMVLAFEPSR